MSDVATRVVLKVGPAQTKFLKLFVGKDGSIYVHTYRPTGTPWMAPPPSLVDIPPGTPVPIHFDTFTPSPFQYNKVSFHASGYIHVTDTAGRRLRDGVRGPAFAALHLPYDLASFAPCEPSRLPLVTKGRYRDIVFDLPLPLAPFSIALSLVDPAAPPPDARASVFGGPVLLTFSHLDLLVALSVWTVHAMDSTPVPWPPFPFHVLRIAA